MNSDVLREVLPQDTFDALVSKVIGRTQEMDQYVADAFQTLKEKGVPDTAYLFLERKKFERAALRRSQRLAGPVQLPFNRERSLKKNRKKQRNGDEFQRKARTNRTGKTAKAAQGFDEDSSADELSEYNTASRGFYLPVVLDSGANVALKRPHETDSSHAGVVRLANDQKSELVGSGPLILSIGPKEVHIRHAYSVPGVKEGIIPLRNLLEAGISIQFDARTKECICLLGEKQIHKISPSADGLYRVEARPPLQARANKLTKDPNMRTGPAHTRQQE